MIALIGYPRDRQNRRRHLDSVLRRSFEPQSERGPVHFHMLLLDGVYVDSLAGPQFRWVKAPSSAELRELSHTIAHRVSRFLERQGILVRDDESAHLTLDTQDDDPMHTLIGHSITYRIATGPRQGRKVLTLQTLPAIDEPPDTGVGNVSGFSLHAGVTAKANERHDLGSAAQTGIQYTPGHCPNLGHLRSRIFSIP